VGIYFRTDTTRLTFRELWGIHPRFPVFLASCVMKLLGIPEMRTTAVLHEDAIRIVPVESIPEAGLAVIGPIVGRFEREGGDAGVLPGRLRDAPLARVQCRSGVAPAQRHRRHRQRDRTSCRGVVGGPIRPLVAFLRTSGRGRR
jgi:hypothetical protein